MSFLPISQEDMKEKGYDSLDFCFVTGDAYVDHPSFGTSILSRILEKEGYRVGIISQPDWRADADFIKLGKPHLAFLVNSGNVDSMVAHYTAAKRKRSDDAYSPGNKAGLRPDRAVTVYCKKLRELYPGTPIIIGGLEASLRRFSHYDYWGDKVLPSVLKESGADILSYGMGENQTIQIAARLSAGEPVSALTDILGTCYMASSADDIKGITLPSYHETKASKEKYALATKVQYGEQDAIRGKRLIQQHGAQYLIQNPPMPPLTTEELDRTYALPYERYYHPSYEKDGGIPAIREVEFSITHNRGCFGACNFCSIAFHQGRQVTVRSEKSVLTEAGKLVNNPHFKGYIHDVGGPTANFRIPSCERQLRRGLCKNKKCLAPAPCEKLEADHSEYLKMLKKLRAIPGIKKVFIRSGIRFDYLMEDESDEFFKELVTHHVSGQLKVAPEHCSAAVLDKMGKPHIEAYKKFAKRFYSITGDAGKEQYLVPYLMSSHPGSTLKDAVELAVFLKRENIRPEQVQDFYPTPGTLSTCMYYTGIDPVTMEPVFVPKTREEKQLQRALLQYFRPQNRESVAKALQMAGRTDLIGTDKSCLIPPSSGFTVQGKGSKTAGTRSAVSPSDTRGGSSKTAHRKVTHKWEGPQKNFGKSKKKGKKS